MIIPCPNCDGEKGHHLPQHVVDGEVVPAGWHDCQVCSGKGEVEAHPVNLLEGLSLMAEVRADDLFHELKHVRLMQVAVGTVAAALKAGDPQALYVLEELLTGFTVAQVRTIDEEQRARRN